jgi:hypothetical protein
MSIYDLIKEPLNWYHIIAYLFIAGNIYAIATLYPSYMKAYRYGILKEMWKESIFKLMTIGFIVFSIFSFWWSIHLLTHY